MKCPGPPSRRTVETGAGLNVELTERVIRITIPTSMTPRERVVTFRPDSDILRAMESLRERDGMPYSEQIRRSLRAWLPSKRVMKAERKRASTRKRP